MKEVQQVPLEPRQVKPVPQVRLVLLVLQQGLPVLLVSREWASLVRLESASRVQQVRQDVLALQVLLQVK